MVHAQLEQAVECASTDVRGRDPSTCGRKNGSLSVQQRHHFDQGIDKKGFAASPWLKYNKIFLKKCKLK